MTGGGPDSALQTISADKQKIKFTTRNTLQETERTTGKETKSVPTRVYVLAKEFGISSTELKERLKEKGVTVKNHLSSLEGKEEEIARSLLSSEAGSLSTTAATQTKIKPKKTKKKRAAKSKKTKTRAKSKKTSSATRKPLEETPFEKRITLIEQKLDEVDKLSKQIEAALNKKKGRLEQLKAELHPEAEAPPQEEVSAPSTEIIEPPEQEKAIEAEKAPAETPPQQPEVKEEEAPAAKEPETPVAEKEKKTAKKKKEEEKPKKSGKRRVVITMTKRQQRRKPLITKPATPLQRSPARHHGKGKREETAPAPAETPIGTAPDKGPGKKHDGKRKTRRVILDKDKKESRREQFFVPSRKKRQVQREVQRPTELDISLPITVKEFSSLSTIRQADLLKFFLLSKKRIINANSHLQEEDIEDLALHYDIDINIKQETDLEAPLKEIENRVDPEELRRKRPPVVTFLGHVDHGKTSILDKIRKSNVQQKEHGGITQHISAYNIVHKDYPITFLDTPGHAAFTRMRSRGAQCTDIAILVVAADDGPMPQTEEAIHHIQDAGVAMIVAINKTDLPTANVLRTKQKLAELGVMPPEWGGNAEMVEISALTGDGIDDLLETIHLVSDVQAFTANPERDAYGVALEARSSGSRGIIVDVLVKQGTLKIGDYILCGHAHGRIRSMQSTTNHEPIEKATPSMPVQILGLSEVPEANEKFYVLNEPQLASSIADQRLTRKREMEQADREREAPTLDDFMSQLQKAAEEKELRILLKGDVKGSVEAIENQVLKLSTDEVKVKIIRSGVGLISEGDIALAEASNGIVLGFNVSIDDRAKQIAEEHSIHIRTHDIIYELLEEVRIGLEDRLDPVYEDKIRGHADIRKVFKSSKLGNICGCYVTDGTITRNDKVHLLRNGETVYTGEISSLRRGEQSTNKVREGIECGIKLSNFEQVEEGDTIECFRTVAKRRSL